MIRKCIRICKVQGTRGVVITLLTAVLVLVILYFFRSHSHRTSDFDLGSRSKRMKKLLDLGESLAKVSHHTHSYKEKKIFNSAFYKVRKLIEDLLKLSANKLYVKYKSGVGDSVLDSSNFYTLTTVVYNFVHNSDATEEMVERIIQDTVNIYPEIHIIVGVPHTLSVQHQGKSNVQILYYKPRGSYSYKETDVWRNLLKKVSTEYVYIGRNITKFTEDIQLNVLVNHMISVGATVVSSSVKDTHTGQWKRACDQSIFKNYTLVYTPGYYMSIDSCFLCNHVAAPFLTHSHVFQHVPLKGGMTSVSGFALWFLELVKLKKIILSCPDSMSYVDNIDGESERDQWLDLVKHSQVEEVYVRRDAHFKYGCDEAHTRCPFSIPASLSLSHCCMNELSNGVKAVMKACQEQNMMCELNDGTLLGALKFNGILPWEIDADISVEGDNFTKFADLVAAAVVTEDYTFMNCVRYYKFFTPMRWFIEIFSISSTDTSRLSKAGISPTRVLLDGEYVATPQSPGLFGRNRYGSEIYQHANHWRKRGGTSSWQFYEAGKFAECVKPGHQSCLDQFVADGSLRFNQNLRGN